MSPEGIFAIAAGVVFAVIAIWGLFRLDNTEASRNQRNALALQHSLDNGTAYYWYEDYDGTFSLRRTATDRAA